MLHSVPDLKTAKAPSVAGHGGNKGGRREFGICGNVEMGRGHLVVGEGDWRGMRDLELGRFGADTPVKRYKGRKEAVWTMNILKIENKG